MQGILYGREFWHGYHNCLMQFELKNIIRILREQGPLGSASKCLMYIRFPFGLCKFRKSNPNPSIQQLAEFAYTAGGGLIKPFQVKAEIQELLKIVKQSSPGIILEIGTAIGGNLFMFSQIASENARIISIDLPGGMYGGGYPRWRIPIYRFFTRDRQKLLLIRADSHAAATRKRIESVLNGRKIDFLFIDGDHTYEGVKKDFEMYRGFVRPDGVIAFHDIVPHHADDGCGVDRFWREIRSDYKTKEIVKNWDQKWAGIGLLRNK